jgi:hypothetical protein
MRASLAPIRAVNAFSLALLSGLFLIAAASSWLTVARPHSDGLSLSAVRTAAAVSAIGLGLLGVSLVALALTDL